MPVTRCLVQSGHPRSGCLCHGMKGFPLSMTKCSGPTTFPPLEAEIAQVSLSIENSLPMELTGSAFVLRGRERKYHQEQLCSQFSSITAQFRNLSPVIRHKASQRPKHSARKGPGSSFRHNPNCSNTSLSCGQSPGRTWRRGCNESGGAVYFSFLVHLQWCCR